MAKEKEFVKKAPQEVQNASAKSIAYKPISDVCTTVDTTVPVSMRFEMQKALADVNRRVNGVDAYVAEKLGYVIGKANPEEKKRGLKFLCDAFSAEQVDAIAVAIYNIEQRNQGLIIGDMTGIGKGRIAAAMIRYGVLRGLKPIFLTEKPNLFSDIFRDMIAIGSDAGVPLEYYPTTPDMFKKVTKSATKSEDDQEDSEDDEVEMGETILVPIYQKNPTYEKDIVGKKRTKPFIVNGASNKTDIKDEMGNIIYKGLPKPLTDNAILKRELPADASFILATYSQFRSAKVTEKMDFLKQMSKGNIVIMDESHNASGSSNSGIFLREVLGNTMGVTWLSATFAKRPDNIPIYASKTAMSEVALDDEALIGAIQRGGVALQEVISSQLVSEGQMVRRERSFEGVEVNYMIMDKSMDEIGKPHLNKEQEHKAIFDKATDIIREIILFQQNYVDPEIKGLDKIMKARQGQVEKRKGTEKAGVDNYPVFNGIFNMISQLLFSLKAEAVAERAIERIREGKAPVIAFASTMESFLNTMTNDQGKLVQEGEIISSDFKQIFKRKLAGVLRYTESDSEGKSEYKMIDINEMSEVFRNEYNRIMGKIDQTNIGLNVSPIDVVKKKIEDAGYRVAEVTGRSRELKIMPKGVAMVKMRQKIDPKDAFRMFNNNEVDVLMINQSGSTGASAHAIVTNMVTRDKVRQRVMIILQAELNINTEVQKRGRINRTGQIYKPIYDYITSAVPAEKRLMMMLRKKLKSLDANTSSNQKQTSMGETDDFLNKYGDVCATEYLKENPMINKMIGDPLKMEKSQSDSSGEKEGQVTENAAHKVSGRVAILSTKDQENFYSEMSTRYEDMVEYLRQTGEYDLEVDILNLQAKTISKNAVIIGKADGTSVFSRHSILEKCEVNALKKPFKRNEVEAMIKESLGNYTSESLKQKTIEDMDRFVEQAIEKGINEANAEFDQLKNGITNERGYKATQSSEKKKEYVSQREVEIAEARSLEINRIRIRFENTKKVVMSVFKFFQVGKVVAYPTSTYEFDHSFHRAIFLGFDIKPGLKNPYALSAIRLRFAIASSDKYIALPASKQERIAMITSLTYSEIMHYESDDILENWDELCKKASADRQIRYIVTGNILQAYGNEQLKGKLIDYSILGGGQKKGILLPESFSPEARGRGDKELRVMVPIGKAISIIKGMIEGRSIETNDKFSIIRRSNDYRILVPSSNKLGAKFFLNQTLINITNEKNFNKIATNMEATVDLNKIDNLVNFLQDEYNCTLSLIQQEAEKIIGNVDVNYDDEIKKNKVDDVMEELTTSERIAQFAEEEREKEIQLAETIDRKKVNIRLKMLKFSNMVISKMESGGSIKNPYAVCTTSIGKKEGTTKRSKWSKNGQKKYESCKDDLTGK